MQEIQVSGVSKICRSCGLALPLVKFDKAPRGLEGRRSTCRRCRDRRPASTAAVQPQPFIGPERNPADIAKEAFTTQRVQRDLRREHSALLEENEQLRAELADVKRLSVDPVIQTYGKAPKTLGDAVACALASDWHVEEPVIAGKLHGLNEYSLHIAETRAKFFFRNLLKLVEMMARECRIETVWLGFLGDFFTNWIHDEGKQTNLLTPTQAANFAKSLLASGIDFLLRESRYKLVIDCVPGNHGRLSVKPQISNATETSLETYMFVNLAERYEGNPRVEFRVAQSKMLYRRFFERFNMRIIHGDDVKFGGGVGGITIPIRKKLAAWDKAIRADLTVMGHFHQRIDGGDFMVNGSLIGFNEFAQAIGASPEEPQQSFFLVSARNGGQKSMVAPIWLDDSHKTERPQ